jgi:hypothetical protein
LVSLLALPIQGVRTKWSCPCVPLRWAASEAPSIGSPKGGPLQEHRRVLQGSTPGVPSRGPLKGLPFRASLPGGSIHLFPSRGPPPGGHLVWVASRLCPPEDPLQGARSRIPLQCLFLGVTSIVCSPGSPQGEPLQRGTSEIPPMRPLQGGPIGCPIMGIPPRIFPAGGPIQGIHYCGLTQGSPSCRSPPDRPLQGGCLGSPLQWSPKEVPFQFATPWGSPPVDPLHGVTSRMSPTGFFVQVGPHQIIPSSGAR